MAKDTDRRRGGFDVGETGGALSGLLAEEEELDRGAIWRLGTWAAVSVGAVIVALLANQSSIGVRREQSASADLLKQAQQLQLATRESQNETRRLSSAVDTLNSDRDRLYSRVAVLEQGLDSVTGTIARQSSPSPPPQTGAGQASASQPSANQGGLGQGSSNQAASDHGTATQTIASAPATASPAMTAVQIASPLPASPATTASIDPSASVAKPTPAPVAAPVATTAAAVADKTAAPAKQDKQPSITVTSELGPSAKPATEPQGSAAQPSGSLVASKSMMGPPDPAAGKLLEPSLPKIPPAPTSEVASVAPKVSDENETATSSTGVLELPASRTEFGVDVGSANSIPGLRALWRGLLKSRSNAALAKLRPVIVIKENNNGLGMQLRLVAGPINDAAAAAKICASLTVSDRGCTTAVFEGQRLALGADEVDKTEANKPEVAKPETGDKGASGAARSSSHRHYYSTKRPKTAEDTPAKPEQSTLSSLIFGKRQ